jgi:enamine deaminase RidA (YjgF/YER057c/UK114 family)
MSQAVVHGGLVFLAGQVAADPSQDVAGQTRQILARIDALLAEAGSDRSRLLSANIWLTDIAMFDQTNSVWDAWATPGSARARATVEARLAGPEFKVEIAAIAALAD